MNSTGHALLVVDSLQGLERIEPVAAVALQPAAQPLSLQSIMDRLAAWQADFVGGQSAATVRAVRADWSQYIRWCEGTGHTPLPASIEQLADFLHNAIVRGRKRSTLNRYLYTVGLVHDAAGLANPVKDPQWHAKWKVLIRELGPRGHQRTQAGQLVAADIARILATLGDTPWDLRDAAMLRLASDTLLRESELVRVEVEHLAYNAAKGNWTLAVHSSKTNQAGEDEDYRYVDPDTRAAIQRWQDAADITIGVLFRPIGGRTQTAVVEARAKGLPDPVLPLRPQEVARIFRRRAVAAGLDHAFTISGHSTRVGSANDLINSGYTTAQIQDAGNWKSAEMVQLYTRRSQAGANSMADMRRRQKANDR